MKNNSIDDVKLIKLPVFKDLKGDLIPIETNTHIPIEVKRFSKLLLERINSGGTRTKHIHSLCLHKRKVLIECDDGKNKKDSFK